MSSHPYVEQRCSGCQEVGHNRRTCPIPLEERIKARRIKKVLARLPKPTSTELSTAQRANVLTALREGRGAYVSDDHVRQALGLKHRPNQRPLWHRALKARTKYERSH